MRAAAHLLFMPANPVRRGGPLTVGGLTAARFLRHQWAEKAALIDTAEDFIQLCATRSEQTGRPCVVQYPGGKLLPAATVLADALKRRRAQASTRTPGT